MQRWMQSPGAGRWKTLLRLEEGMEIITTGRISSYPKSLATRLLSNCGTAGEGALRNYSRIAVKNLPPKGCSKRAAKTFHSCRM